MAGTETGIDTADEALPLMARIYPNREPPLRTRLFLEEILERGGS